MPQLSCWHECDCECHEYPGVVRHIIYCCTKCPKCGRNIKRGWLKDHLKTCHKKTDKEAKDV